MDNKVVISSFLWRFLERCGAQAVAVVVSIVLARLLEPELYGIIAIVTVFISILQVFVDSGMGNALIQKKDADDLDFSTVFYFNLLVCIALYVLMFFVAPAIAYFYDMPSLTAIIRVLSLMLIISGIKNVQQAFVSRNMLFKKFFFSTLGGTLTAAVVGILLAYNGFGVWALVAQQLVNATIDTTILWITVKWRPKKMFSMERLKGMFSFAWKLLVSSLIDVVYNNMQQLIIGKMYTKSELAYYNQGKNYNEVIVTNINTAIDSVLLPTMSKVQDSAETVKAMTRRSITVSTYVMAPLMLGMASVSTQLVSVLLTDKWLPCVPFMIIFCITFLFYPMHTANLNAIKAMGRSHLFLKLEIIKKVVGLGLLLSTMWFGVMAIAYSLLVNTFCSMVINAWPNKKLLNYPYLEQVKDILPNLLSALAMAVCVWGLGRILPFGNAINLVIQIVSGMVIYVVISYITRNPSFNYALSILKNKNSEK